MKKKIFTLLAVTSSLLLFSQVGIKTVTPSSTLDIKGSIEGNFREITSTETLNATDYHVSFSGTSNSVLNLPTKSSTDDTTADFRGRKYYIKNNSVANVLTLTAATGETLRLGAGGSVNTFAINPGTFVIITASSINGWDLDLAGSAINNNWSLVNSDLNGIINTFQAIPVGTTYTTINNSAVTVVVPSGAAVSKVALNFTGWGHVRTGVNKTGSLRFQILQTGASSTVYNSVMMSSWAGGDVATTIRFNFPVVYTVNNLAPGTYTFRVQVVREEEGAGAVIAGADNFGIWGIQAKGDVYIKDN